MKICPKCKCEYDDNQQFCTQDGTQLEKKTEYKKCPACGAENPSIAKFCNECGDSLQKKEFKCIKCQTIYESNTFSFCPACGGKIECVETKSLKEQLSEANEKIHQSENDINSLKQELSEKERYLLDEKNQIEELNNTKNKLENEKNKYEQKISSLNSEISRLENENKKLKNKQPKEEKTSKSKIINPDNLVLLDRYETPFYISKYQVTQELYKKVMGENPSYFHGSNLPVESVSWYDAIYFCNKLSELEGLTPVYSVNGYTDLKKWNYHFHKGKEIKGEISQSESANGYRLPTIKEWVYAAKGGQNFNFSGSNNLDEVGWYDNNSGEKTHAVAQKKPNGYGLYDMNGNVCEWVWDSNGRYRCLCGGSYHSIDSNCEVDCWYSDDAYFQFSCIGFRIVRSK